MSERNDRFFEHLRHLDAGALARLRRSLAFEPPGSYAPAFRYVEPFTGDAGSSQRAAMYLVAGLYALEARSHPAGGNASPPSGDDDTVLTDGDAGLADTERVPSAPDAASPHRATNLGATLGTLWRSREASLKGSGQSIERRFTSLLDADEGQLSHRLRQMVTLLLSEGAARIDWAELLNDLTYWNSRERYVQRRWARAFYAPAPSSRDTNGKVDA